jgi:hypothetical protein
MDKAELDRLHPNVSVEEEGTDEGTLLEETEEETVTEVEVEVQYVPLAVAVDAAPAVKAARQRWEVREQVENEIRNKKIGIGWRRSELAAGLMLAWVVPGCGCGRGCPEGWDTATENVRIGLVWIAG